MNRKLTLIFSLFTVLLLGAQNNALFEQATTAYNAKEYEKAVTYYEEILENGEHSASVYYNLGNAYYRLNKIAESIYFYEKALLLAPNDQEIKTNLSYANNMTLDAIDTLPETGISKLYKNVTGKFTFDQWAYLSIVFIFLFVILYITFYFSDYSARKRWSFIGSLVALFLCFTSIAFAFVQQSDFNAAQPAIIFAEESIIKSEPNITSQQVFILHEGTKVNISEEFNDYYKINLSDGKTGWILKSELKKLKDF